MEAHEASRRRVIRGQEDIAGSILESEVMVWMVVGLRKSESSQKFLNCKNNLPGHGGTLVAL